MKQNLITDVIQRMLPYLNNAQTERLQEVLQYTLFDYEVTKIKKDEELSEQNLVESFLSAKRIEGCSEKTLKYYNATIQAMLDGIGKGKDESIGIRAIDVGPDYELGKDLTSGVDYSYL